MATTTSLEAMKAAFPSKPFTVSTTPNLQTLLKCRQHLNHCAKSHPHRNHPLGHLYLALPAELYALETATPYPERTPDPGPTVRYGPNSQDIARRNAENVFNVAYKDHHDENTMDRALIDRFYEMLGDYAEDVRDDAATIANPTFLQIYKLAADDWGATTPQQRDANLASINAEWHENDGMKLLFRRVKAAITFSVTCGHRIPDNMIVDKVLIVICRTQAYKQQYLAFKQLPVQDYTNLMRHFKQAERDRLECEDAAAQHGYGMNAEEEENDMAKHLNDLAQAITENEMANKAATASSEQYNDMILQLQNGMANLQHQLLATQQMQQQMAANMQQQPQLNMTMTNPPVYQRQHQQGQHQGRQPFAPLQNSQRNPQARNQLLPNTQPMMTQPFQQNNNSFGGQGNTNSNRSFTKNPVKRFENYNYCHTCGFDISASHSSANCPKPGPNHQYNATRTNIMNGSRKGSHKTIMPSAVGKICQDVINQQRKARKLNNRGQSQMQGGHPTNGQQQFQQQQFGRFMYPQQGNYGQMQLNNVNQMGQQQGMGNFNYM